MMPVSPNDFPNSKSAEKFWFTLELAPPSLRADFAEHQRPVSNNPSRKRFLTKLLGLTAVAGVAPKLLAGSPQPAATGGKAARAPGVIELRPESRAVARREDTV